METEVADRYPASNGDCSPKKEKSRLLVDLSASATNGHNPPNIHIIKQEDGTDDDEADKKGGLEETGPIGEEGSGLEEPMIDSLNNLQDGVSVADGTSDSAIRLPNDSFTLAYHPSEGSPVMVTLFRKGIAWYTDKNVFRNPYIANKTLPEIFQGERPFQCSQCGVSFTQKGNLLRHIKLHTGEKPFKCPFCSYACRRRDALTGHLRTHSVGKPHKCNYCGRSYKQRASLEEHKERCHNYLQSINMDPNSKAGPHQGESPTDPKPPMETLPMVTYDRPPVIERLQGNLGKRKSTTPQKFVGEKLVRYGYPDMPYEMGLKYEKEAELLQVHMMDQALNGIPYMTGESLRPLVPPPLSMADPVSMTSLFSQVYPLGLRPSNREALPPPPPPPPDFSSSANGPLCLARRKNPQASREESPSNSYLDSAESERSSPQERPVPRSSPGHKEEGRGTELSTAEAYRVFTREGQEVRAHKCEPCRLLFLDHVMYTIHMGCHGYRDPLECNICGFRSQDRYEFSSHIIRGEHIFH